MKTFSLFLLATSSICFATPTAHPSGWGIDSRILSLQSPERQTQFLQLLQENHIQYTREALYHEDQMPAAIPVLKIIQQHGIQTVCVFPWKDNLTPSHVTGSLEPDLMQVYLKARTWGETLGNLIPVWELANEPDIGFVRAMPDQYAAWSKAAFLGFKSITTDQTGQPFTPTILMGSQSLPPGPWLKRAAANDLLRYTDAYNQHFYGHPENLSPLIKSVRTTLAQYHQQGQLSLPALPIWITECGIRISPDSNQQEDADLRARQAEYFIQTTQAAANEKIAVFMPYSLYTHQAFSLHQKVPFSPFPAWNAYQQTAQSNPLNTPKAVESLPLPNPVVCQWRPTPQRSLPHKTSGSYRFRDDALNGQRSMSGEIVFYNFSSSPISGTFSWNAMPDVRMTVKSIDSNLNFNLEQRTIDLELAPMSSQSVPVLFFTYTKGYFNNPFSAAFQDTTKAGTTGRSHLHFHLEATPQLNSFEVQTITGRPPFKLFSRILNNSPFRLKSDMDDFAFHYIDRPTHQEFTSVHGPWLGINQVKVAGPWLNPLAPGSKPGSFSLNQPWLFTPHRQAHLKAFPMAITQVKGLPQQGFLVVQADRDMTPDKVQMRVDLIDVNRRRFTISENRGLPYYSKSSSVLLNIKDFHPYFWGHHASLPLDPADVREIQLRFYYAEPENPAGFRIYWVTPHSDNKTE